MSRVLPLESALAAGDTRSTAAELRHRWRSGQQPRIEEYLAERPAESPAELAAIARVDLRQRWRRGERPRADEYLARFPAIGISVELAIDVIYSEFLAREELGEQPQVADFTGAYPEYAEELAAQIRLHRALDSEATSSPTSATDERDTMLLASSSGRLAGAKKRLAGIVTDYEILDEIGRGGMGIVYRARQLGLNRLVALKMVRSADGDNPELLDRFRSEAEAVARLHHPNIVQIFDYGEHDSLPYLALELVAGETLAARLGGRRWPARPAAALVASLARAVQFAHEQGVIHRDLKPANILIEASSSEPSATPERVKIADFGLAKVFHEGQFARTQTGAILGTPSYMAPEQAGGLGDQIGPATDVYALGAILYELLAGRPAFQGPTMLATLQQVLQHDPPPLGRLYPRVPRDLATICAKCLNKEPRQRYASADALASDLERFLSDRPILARRTGVLERSWRWCRRNPVVATLATSVAVLLLAVAAVSTASSLRLAAELKKTERAENAERDAKQTAQLRLWDAYLAEITARTAGGQIGRRFAALETADRAGALLDKIGRTSERERQLRNATIAALALPDMRRLRQIAGPVPTGINCALAANRYVSSTPGGELLLCDLEGRVLVRIEHREADVRPVISPDGRYVGVSDALGSKVWRIAGEQATVVWEEAGADYLALAPDCRHAAVSGADRAMHWIDLESGQRVLRLGRGPARSSFSFHEPSRRIVVAATESVQVISWESGAVLAELPALLGALSDVAWHPQGEYVALSGNDDGVALWHVATRRQVLAYPHLGVVKVSFVGNGDYLLTHNVWDAHLRMWHTGTGRELLSDPTFSHFRCEPAPSGQQRLLAIDAAGLALWEVETAGECASLPHGLAPSHKWRISLAISPDGRLLMIGGARGLELWDLQTMRLAAQLETGVAFATFIGDGSLVVRYASGVFRWPRSVSSPAAADAPDAIRFGPPERLFGATVEPKFAVTPDGSALAVRSSAGWRIVRAASPELPLPTGPEFDPRTVALSSDGGWVALGCWNAHGVSVLCPRTGQQIAHLPTGPHAWPLFSPDNRWLATTPDGVRVWSTADWQLAAEVHARGDTASTLGITFSPDSRALAVGQPTGATRLVDPATGDDWAVLMHPDQCSASYLAFSGDQTRLITAPIDGARAVHVWDLTAIRAELSRRKLDWPSHALRPRETTQTSRAAVRPVEVSFDRGANWSQEEAASLLSLARASRNAARLDLLVQVIGLDPNNAHAHNELAWLLATGAAELRDPATAVTHARRAVELAGDDHNYLNTLGAALQRAGQDEEAIAVLQRALDRSPPELAPYDLVFLALAHAALQDWPAASDFFERTTAAIDAQRQSLTPGRLAELDRFLSEARALGLPR